MKKISVLGGAPITLCDASGNFGANWGDDGNIVAALGDQNVLVRVPAAGGVPQPVTKMAKGDLTHRWPQVLPGSTGAIFTAHHSFVAFEDARIDAVSFQDGKVKTLVRGGYFGRYLPTAGHHGHLIYVHQGVLFGLEFDPERLEVRGDP